MTEPTHRQHLILEEVQREGRVYKTDEDLDIYWKLVRNDYLKHTLLIFGNGWFFELTDKAIEYLDSFK